ncbi:MAG: phytanoyl-CoA dioxygenase family protein [Pseudomonadota bacterium]
MPYAANLEDLPLIHRGEDEIDALVERFPEHEAVIKSLHEDGFAIVDLDLNPDDVGRARALCHSIPPDKGRVQDAWKSNSAVARIATEPRLVTLLSNLYGRQAFPFQTLNFDFGTEQSAHSDTYHFNARPYGFMCGVWVALEDVTENAGPLFYYPGSQNLPILERSDVEGDQSYQDYEQQLTKMISAGGYKKQKALLKQGQALIWTANLVHGGAPRLNPSLTRYSQVTHYFFEGCAYYTPRLFDLSQNRHSVREPFSITQRKFVASDQTELSGHPSWMKRLWWRRDIWRRVHPSWPTFRKGDGK